MASTKNQLDYDSVREALTVLFDEQITYTWHSALLQHGGRGHRGDEDWWDDGTSWAATAWEESSEWPVADVFGFDSGLHFFRVFFDFCLGLHSFRVSCAWA